MPERSRGPDYLYLHASVSRRVSNLETGVHPVRSEFGYGESYGPTLVTVVSAVLQVFAGGTTDQRLRWQRRAGVASFVGALNFRTGKTHGDLAAGELVGTVPPQARPTQPLRMQGQLSVAPWFFQYTLGTDGALVVLKPSGPAAGATYDLHFDSSAWAVN